VAIALVSVVTTLTLCAAIIAPFPVELSILLVTFNGELEHAPAGTTAHLLRSQFDTPLTLKPGDSIRLAEDSTAILTLDAGQGRIVINGPATLTLISLVRRASLPGHLVVSQRFPRRFELILEQAGGTASYVFDPATFATQLDIKILLPETTFVPDQPCWSIVLRDAESPSIREYLCSP
jgi:hypothetical protein